MSTRHVASCVLYREMTDQYPPTYYYILSGTTEDRFTMILRSGYRFIYSMHIHNTVVKYIYIEYSIIHIYIYRNLHCCDYCCTVSHIPELSVEHYGSGLSVVAVPHWHCASHLPSPAPTAVSCADCFYCTCGWER